MSALDFTDRRVLVIGGSRGGIGAAIARAFEAQGAEVTVTGIEAEPVGLDPARFAYRRLDVADDAAFRAFAEEVETLDVLIYAAGIARRGVEPEVGAFRQILEVNLTGTFQSNLLFADALEKRQGAVVNIASMYSFFGNPKGPGYGASKAGVAQLTKSMAGLLAPRGIRVNAIAPGFVRTEQSAAAYAEPEHRDAVTKRTPMARWGEPDDIAGAALFLASPLAGFVTGVVLPVDGGYSAV